MTLLRAIDTDPVRQAIVQGIAGVCRALGIRIIAERIETIAEMLYLESQEIDLLQGYLFARPEVEKLPQVSWPVLEPSPVI